MRAYALVFWVLGEAVAAVGSPHDDEENLPYSSPLS